MNTFTRILCLLCVTCCVTLCSAAGLSSDKPYRIESLYYGTGAVVTGAQHDSSALLYYLQGQTTADDGWWYFRTEGDGYVIINAKSGQYMTYSPDRIEGVSKGIVLTNASEGSKSQWVFKEAEGGVRIYNVYQTDACFNLRIDGTYLLGTYSGGGTNNEVFTLYDTDGKAVDPLATNTGTDDYSGTMGINAAGEYWERTGLEKPIAYTTDANDPVLYSIYNLRAGTYVTVSDNRLAQAAKGSSRTHFYFVSQDGGIQIFTESGRYVTTSYLQLEQSAAAGLSVKQGTPEGKRWIIKWEETSEDYYGSTTQYNGYAIARLDNRPTEEVDNPTSESPYNYWNAYNNAPVIGLWDLDGGSTFLLSSADTRHLSLLQEQGVDPSGGGSTETKLTFNTAVDTLWVGDHAAIYDEWSKTYLLSIDPALRSGGTMDFKLRPAMHSGYADYQVALTTDATAGTIVTTGSEGAEASITNPSCKTTYTLQLLSADGTAKVTAGLQLTFLPVVEMKASGSINGGVYTRGTLRVCDGEDGEVDTTLTAAFKFRGVTAQSMSKKSYAIKLYDAEGNSLDHEYFGLRDDNNWILDAMAVDPACMRNRVSTDLWNDFSTAPYYKADEKKARTGTRGRFVEVVLNGRYLGLYCMTEKLDRKQLKLKKYVAADKSKTGEEEIHGLLYKSSQWCYEVFMGHESDKRYFPGTAPSPYYNTLGKETWTQYELKYPDYEKEAVDWRPLWNAVYFVATSSQDEFDAGVKDYFDYPVLRDYYLFMDLLLTTDNHGKNLFYYVYDKTGKYGEKLGLAPWDLDGTWGSRWDGSKSICKPTADFETFIWQYEHGQLTTYYKLANSKTIDWQNDLATRYAELRKTYFDAGRLRNRFADYAELFADSHADDREQRRWAGTPFYHTDHSDLQGEATYIQDWLEQRLETLDKKYGYDPNATAVNEAVSDAYLKVTGASRSIAIHSGKVREVKIYDLQGRCVRTVTTTGQGLTTVGGLTPQVYIVAGQKVVVTP